MTGFSYCRLRESRLSLLRRGDSEDDLDLDRGGASRGSIGSNGEEEELHNPKDRHRSRRAWCKLAYWEYLKRVGDQFPVEESSVDIFAGKPKRNRIVTRGNPVKTGMCLENVFECNPDATEKIVSCRKKIGQGIILSKDESTDRVWVHNRTVDMPIFVNSPTADPDSPHSVRRIPPGYSASVFDYTKTRTFKRRIEKGGEGPVDVYSVAISFAKGWGKDYTRQEVSACPCWLQVCLEPR